MRFSAFSGIPGAALVLRCTSPYDHSLPLCLVPMQVRSKAAQAFSAGRDTQLALLRGAACQGPVQRMTMQQGPGGAGKRRRRRGS